MIDFCKLGYDATLDELGMEKVSRSINSRLQEGARRIGKGIKGMFARGNQPPRGRTSTARTAPGAPAAPPMPKKPIDPNRYKQHTAPDARGVDKAFSGKAVDRAALARGAGLLKPLVPAAAVGGIGYLGMTTHKADSLGRRQNQFRQY